MSSSPALSAASSPGVQIPPLPPGAQAPALVGWVAKEARHRPSEPELLQPESLSPVSHMSKRQSFPAVPHMRLSSRSPGLSTSPLPSPSPELVQPTPRRPWGGQSTPPATSTPFAFRSARLSVSTLGGSPLSQSPAANSTRLSSPDKAGMPDPDAHTPHNRSTHDLASTPRGGTRLPVSTIANSLPAAKPGYVSSPQAKPVPPTTAKARATQPGKPRSIAASNPEHTFHPQPPLLPPGAAALPLKISAALAGVPLTAGPTTGPAPVTSTTTLSTSLALPKPTAEASTSTRPASAPSLAKPAGNPLTSHPQPVPTLLPGMRPARAPPIVRPIPLHINTAYRDIDAGRLFVPSGLPKEPPAYDPNWAVDTDPGRPEKGVFQH
ncbi:hypothetical protein CspeluHIS016_0108090 [Cutaneotrichosporon spelunceum]|uniref:Uncharacterized protein n=1 Tax=Cutaneotrichosporon spelunceum TaxID=1672016 RepID=A0AAD3TNP6_9TREE|nr:hypothetical protein CspeluHIS016_0108090 [Cutaneotrichosporon spelunceum]